MSHLRHQQSGITSEKKFTNQLSDDPWHAIAKHQNGVLLQIELWPQFIRKRVVQ